MLHLYNQPETDGKVLFLDKSKNQGREANQSAQCSLWGPGAASELSPAATIHLSRFAPWGNDRDARKTPGSQVPFFNHCPRVVLRKQAALGTGKKTANREE